jgi:hypothetical protein
MGGVDEIEGTIGRHRFAKAGCRGAFRDSDFDNRACCARVTHQRLVFRESVLGYGRAEANPSKNRVLQHSGKRQAAPHRIAENLHELNLSFHGE